MNAKYDYRLFGTKDIYYTFFLFQTWPYNAHNTVKECSSADDDDYRYDCYNDTLEEKSYSNYDTTYYKSSINS